MHVTPDFIELSLILYYYMNTIYQV